MTTNKSKNLIMSVKLDWTFKELMMKEEIRNSFISAVLEKRIKWSRVLNTFLSRDFFDDKLGILDVRIELEDKTQIDIEIQVIPFKEWAERTLFYTSKMYVEQIKSGEQYNVLNRCINISVLDFSYLQEKEFFNTYHIRNDRTNSLYTDKIGFYIIELPKIPDKIETMNDLQIWVKFINSNSEEEMKMLASKSQDISVAYDELKRLSNDDDKRAEYEARQKAIRDYNSLIYQYKQEGLKEGIEKGFEKGIEKGKMEEKITSAKKFLEMGLTVEQVSKGTGLTIEQIKGLDI